MKDFLDALEPGSAAWRRAKQIRPERLPRHIAVIMDGNGRWAGKRFLPRTAGHRAGVDAVRDTVESCCRLGVEALTVYAFSVENWKRPRREVSLLWDLLRQYLRLELDRLLQNNVRLQAIGRISELPTEVQKALDEAIAATAGNTGLRLNLALNYGGRAEIVDAVNGLLAEARRTGQPLEISEQELSARLYTRELPDPDLLIRTSGEMRISNFLLWQLAYTEIWVTDKLWPDFRAADLVEAILNYQSRERRFGGLAAGETEPTASLVGAPHGAEAPEES